MPPYKRPCAFQGRKMHKQLMLIFSYFSATLYRLWQLMRNSFRFYTLPHFWRKKRTTFVIIFRYVQFILSSYFATATCGQIACLLSHFSFSFSFLLHENSTDTLHTRVRKKRKQFTHFTRSRNTHANSLRWTLSIKVRLLVHHYWFRVTVSG